MAGLLNGGCKAEHVHVALHRVFGQGLEDDLLDRGRDLWLLLLQRGWFSKPVLDGEFCRRSAKGTASTEPFIGQHCQGILVAGRTRLPAHLFGSHVGQGAKPLLHLECVRS